ncbi:MULTISPECIES: hypothetical protein [unclassified Pseudomonas]|uniref:hypothetical protein n=1 Tax=unclassified Pseudomonas TaxID=196821 RepID=UPI002ACB072F|nr:MULTISPECIES: hypothetical protein [unclassified Pseudomonas]MEB0043693.1 hypothetical protein [Pseudomonas sp. MH10]MEB0090631.1 hypothetical protein [Pseudomonas sp. CCI4.2]MEB0119891.1 hypothetical protein [Pseudomonas sp. CCI1.2]WPX54750.1 hypothetical protein RHM65_03970 [Pseudomonas sp. CCI4.2]WPX62208.1 hypothetical protein RHM59_14770 [Pseudomonas sp. MH10]
MSDFQFPIRKADGSPYKDADHVHRLLGNEQSGFYLLGQNRYWHGGIHISDRSAPQCVYNQPVRCIAEGEVVAYRLNKDYLVSQLEPESDAQKFQYSTSFCLVRHTHKSPPNPEEGPNHGKQNSLVFYSLYMHLLPYDCYRSDDPTYKKRVEVVIGGWSARNVPLGEPGSMKLGVISPGTQFDIVEESAPSNGYRFVKGVIVRGQVGRLKKGDEVWFADQRDGQAIRGEHGQLQLKPVAAPARTKPKYWQGRVTARVINESGMQMYCPRANGEFGVPISSNCHLPHGYGFSFDSESTHPVRMQDGSVLPTAECIPYNAVIRGETMPQSYWAFVDDKSIEHLSVEPSRLDSVIVPGTPIPIKAGDPIGYLGLYEMPDGASKKTPHQMHFEIFTCDPGLDAFLNNDAKLTHGKQYLEVLKLQPTIVGRDTETDNPTYLFKDHIFALNALPIVKDENRNDAYQITVQERARTKGKPLRSLTALIKKDSVDQEGSGVRIVNQYDLSAIGFKVVEQHAQNSFNPLTPERIDSFYAHLHALADRNSDGNVTAEELQETLKNPEFRSRWSKLIAYHYTEWQTKSDGDRWQAYREQLKDNPNYLRHESERIDNLVFWDDVAKAVGLPEDGRVWHFHPVEFVAALSDNLIDENSLDWLTVPHGQLTFDVEGNDAADPANGLHRYFSRKIHWPGGASGITIGRGYDLGQRPNPEIDLVSAGISEPLLGWLLGAKGLSGQAAQAYLGGATAGIKNSVISRKQQYELFLPVYDEMKKNVLRISSDKRLLSDYGSLDWNNTHPKIQDVTVDLIYRGDYTAPSRAYIQRSIVENNFPAFCQIIRDRSRWPNVPPDRFNRRALYLSVTQ